MARWSDFIEAFQLVNEFKGFPSAVGIDVDLDAAAQWWDKVGTPTTAVTMIDVAGDAITEAYEYGLKTVVDAASEGLSQTWTFADEPRVKSGRTMSVICAIWPVDAISITVKLLNSDASETADTLGEAAAGQWNIVKIEGHVLAGTSCAFQVTASGAGTFYVVPLGAGVGPAAMPLGPRPLRYVQAEALAVDNVDPADTNWVDVDLTAATSPLACMAQIHCENWNSDTSTDAVYVRRNGSASAQGAITRVSAGTNAALRYARARQIVLDDGQVYEYSAENASVNGVTHALLGYWEWA